MTELLTAAQMRSIEQAAIDSGEVTGLELMERAGRGVVEAIFEEWPELAKTSHRAVVLCGPGNNGGDGFVVARLLKEWGWEVEVFLYGDPEKLPPDARVNYERWGELGEANSAKQMTFSTNSGAAVCVDAMFGTGLSRRLDTEAQGALSLLTEASSAASKPKCTVAIDVPSGFDADSGRLLDNAEYPNTYPNYYADLVVSFHLPKRGHYLQQLLERLNRPVTVKSLGIWDDLHRLSEDQRCWLADEPEYYALELEKLPQDHKYHHGHALILSGSPGKTGAARLAARGALRIGSGLVTIACPEDALTEIAAQTTAIMCTPLPSADALKDTLKDQRLNALCLGPGLGIDRAKELVLIALAGVEPRPTVLDADALTAFESDPDQLFTLLHKTCVLTPHAGEFKRLFPNIAAKLDAPATKGPAYSKVDATREAAKRAGCTVLFKGPDTVIADPSGRAAINSSAYNRAAPWLATAGSGDVLAGFITGLLARGFAPMQAAETAAWLHTECALKFGPGLIAEDLPETLPAVLKDLL